MSDAERTAPAPESATLSHFPAWCAERTCDGEHYSEKWDSIPATGGLSRFSRYGGVFFPTVDVSLSWDTVDNLRPSIALAFHSEMHPDSQVDLHLHEARALLDTLAEAIAALEFSGVPA